MGAASLSMTGASAVLSGVVLAFMWVHLKAPESLSPLYWSLGGAALCAAGNLSGQTLALFGLSVPGRVRRLSVGALVLGIPGLAGLLAGVVWVFWNRGLLVL